MATDAEIEAAIEAFRTTPTGPYRTLWVLMQRALDAAASVRAEADAVEVERQNIIACIRSTTWGGTEEIVAMIRRRGMRKGADPQDDAPRKVDDMEIVRLVASIGLWRDQYPDSYTDKVLCSRTDDLFTPGHVYQARAVVAAAERKEVMVAVAPQPPAPAEGGTDVAGLVEELSRWPSGDREQAHRTMLRAAATLTAQAEDIAALEAALRPFAKEAERWPNQKRGDHFRPYDGEAGENMDFTVGDLRHARALSGKEPQQP